MITENEDSAVLEERMNLDVVQPSHFRALGNIVKTVMFMSG